MEVLILYIETMTIILLLFQFNNRRFVMVIKGKFKHI